MPEAFFARMQGISDSMAGFSSVVAGGAGVTEHGGQTLVKAVERMHTGVTEALRNATLLGQEPPLGTTAAAQVRKPFLDTVATHPAQGIVTAAKQFQEDLEKFRTNVEKAGSTYRARPDSNEMLGNDALLPPPVLEDEAVAGTYPLTQSVS